MGRQLRCIAYSVSLHQGASGCIAGDGAPAISTGKYAPLILLPLPLAVSMFVAAAGLGLWFRLD